MDSGLWIFNALIVVGFIFVSVCVCEIAKSQRDHVVTALNQQGAATHQVSD